MHHRVPRCGLLARKQDQELELQDLAWRQPFHPPEPFPAARQRKRVLRAAGDGLFPPLGSSFSFFALFRYVKTSGGKLGRCGAGAVWSHGSCHGSGTAVLHGMGPACPSPCLSLRPEMLRRIPTAGLTPQQPRGHGASLAPHFELALLFPRQEEAGSWHSGWAALPPDTPVRSQQCFNSRDLALSARLPASFSMSNDTNVLLALSPALGCSPGCSQAPLSLPCLCFTSEQLPSVCLSPFSPPTQLPDGVKCPKGEANQADRL